jgi:hypothetical protein
MVTIGSLSLDAYWRSRPRANGTYISRKRVALVGPSD